MDQRRLTTDRTSVKSYRGMLPALGAAIFLTMLAQTVFAQGVPGAARPFLGVRLENVTGGGVRVSSVLPGSPAANAGVEARDIVLRVAGRPVATSTELISAVGSSNVGDSVQLSLTRAGRALTVVAVLAAAPRPDQVLSSFLGRPAPSMDLPRVDGGGRIDLAGQRGRVVLVYFWSVWCGACRMATPTLERWQRALGQQGLTIVGVSDDPLDRLRQETSSLSLSFPLVHDSDAKIGATYWVNAIPAFFLVDQAGNVVLATEGWDASQSGSIEREILRLLGQGGP